MPSYHYADSFSVISDEFTRKQYHEIEIEARRLQRLDAPFSFEPFEQTLMRMLLQARGCEFEGDRKVVGDVWESTGRTHEFEEDE